MFSKVTESSFSRSDMNVQHVQMNMESEFLTSGRVDTASLVGPAVNQGLTRAGPKNKEKS